MDIIKHGENYCDMLTGEVISKSEAIEYYNNKQSNEFNTVSEEMIKNGLEPINQLIKYRNREYEVKNVKEKFEYRKVFNIELQKLISEKFFDKNEFLVIGALSPFIQFPYNDIVIKGKYLTFEELGDMCYLNKNLIAKTLKSLQKKEVIYIVQAAKRPPVIYFNPFLYSCGLVHNDTFDMFKESIFNPYK